MNTNTREFASACYEENSVEELEAALEKSPDATDCATWGLTEEEWIEGVKHALRMLAAS